MSKPANKFIKDIYFSKKWRNWNKAQFLKLEQAAAEMWQNLDSLTPDERSWASSLAQLSALGQQRIAEAEEFARSTRITHRTFRLYRRPGCRRIVVIFHFYKPSEKCYKFNSWLIPAGLPSPSSPRRKAELFRHSLPTEEYMLKDSGKFEDRGLDVDLAACTMRGRHKIYKFKVKTIGKSDTKIWLQLLDGKKAHEERGEM